MRPSVDVIGAFLARDIDDMHQIPCKDGTDQSAKKKGSVLCVHGCAIRLGVITVLTEGFVREKLVNS